MGLNEDKNKNDAGAVLDATEKNNKLMVGKDVYVSGRCFRILEKKGSGTYGSVYKVRDGVKDHDKNTVQDAENESVATFNSDGSTMYALKIEDLDDGYVHDHDEGGILNRLQTHCNIITLHLFTPTRRQNLFLMEWMEGGHLKLYSNKKRRDGTVEKIPHPPALVQTIMQQLWSAVAHIHSRGVLHLDIKPANIVVSQAPDHYTKDIVVKLCDFNTAERLPSMQPAKGNDEEEKVAEYIRIGHEVVTVNARPPENLLWSRKYMPATDVWSVGVVFASLIRGRSMYTSCDKKGVLKEIAAALGPPTAEKWPHLTRLYFDDYTEFDEVTATLKAMRGKWSSNMEKRYCILFEGSPVFTEEARDLLSKTMHYDRHERITASDALCHQYFTEKYL